MVPTGAVTTLTRHPFWQVGPLGKAIFYYLAAVAIALFLVGLYRRFDRYTNGTAEAIGRLSGFGSRLWHAILIVASNAGQFDRDWFAGVLHTFIFWGFLGLFVGTVILAVDMDVWTPLGYSSFFVGQFYLTYSFVMDVIGGLFVVGVVMALLQRYWFEKPRLKGPHTDLEDDLFIIALFVIGVGGFFVEAVRLLARGFPTHEGVSFLGMTLAIGLDGLGVSPGLATDLYLPIWWFHAIIALSFVAILPYAKPVHMLTSFANVIARDPDAGKCLPQVPEDADPSEIGVDTIEDFSWKHMLDHDACTNCGRCSSVCPAVDAGRPLDPRDVILDLQSYGRAVQRGNAGDFDIVSEENERVIDAETMRACMSCLACMDACPVEIEHVPQFTELNRRLVESGQLDGATQETMMNLFQQGNVFDEPSRRRADWTHDLPFEIPDAREHAVEYLWFVGDYPSYDPRNQAVATALAHLFEAADVSYGILYEAEQNPGNDVRRVGEEGLFEMLAEDNLEALQSAEFETLVTTDPHAYNTLRNEYDQFGFDRGEDVKHYTQVIEQLIVDGDIRLTGTELDRRVTYHDPCHLGRYNEEYEAPRAMLEATGADLDEMPRNRRDAVCCGGGGGGLWTDVEEEEKPAEARLTEAVGETDSGSDLEQFVVACPGCLTMFEDGAKTGGIDELEIVDLAELVWDAVETRHQHE